MVATSQPAMDNTSWVKKYDTDAFVYTKDVNQFVVELCGPLAPGKAIDVAGGEGRNAVYFAELGWQAENIDISNVGLTKFLKFAEERGVSEKVFANCADATGFESVLTPVDLGVVAYLQIEVNDLADALDCLIENIRKGGVLFGVWHSRANLSSDYSGQQNPDLLADIDEIREIMADQPVEIEVLENLEGQIQTKDGLKPSITVILLARRL